MAPAEGCQKYIGKDNYNTLSIGTVAHAGAVLRRADCKVYNFKKE
jgi:hypothetical protein